MHPDLQQRVYDEMQCIHLENGVDINQNDLAHLKYLDMFIKETMRLYPSVPFLTRTLGSDIKLGKIEMSTRYPTIHLIHVKTTGGYDIPAGVEFVVGVMAMHRSRDNFKNDPETFNPDNFLPENNAARHAYSYIPFSGGPRGCIGNLIVS